MNVVETRGLARRFGSIWALRGLDLAVAAGSIVGLLGSNGAGKTTLIRALSGSLRPTVGSVMVAGANPLRDAARVRRAIGYMPQAATLYEDLSARDNVAFFGAPHLGAGLAARVDATLEFVGLSDRSGDPVYTFSGGMKQRVSLACALVHQPQVLLLDEPTAGVDPRLKERFWHEFRGLAASGVTLLLSTHLMDEALLCDRLVVLHAGREVAQDTPQELLRRGRARLVLTRGGQSSEAEIAAGPGPLATALHADGLAASISAVDVQSDTLEEVIRGLIQAAEAEAGA